VDKKYKNAIFKKFTGTTSKTEFENLKYAELHNIRVEVEKFMKVFRSSEAAENPIQFIENYAVDKDEKVENEEVFT